MKVAVLASIAGAALASASAIHNPRSEDSPFTPLQSRNIPGTGIKCKEVAGNYAAFYAFEKSSRELEKRRPDETLHAPAGPRNCVRAACVEGADVALCNDNPYPINIRYRQIRDFAWELYRADCTIPFEKRFNSKIKGQIFNEAEHWNVIVKKADDC